MKDSYISPSDKAEVRKLMKGMRIVIFFHWKDCGHCTHTMPHWDKLCKNKAKHGLGDIKMVKVEKESIPEEAGINGFPTFFIKTKSGKTKTIGGSRDSEEQLGSELHSALVSGGRRRTRRRNTRRFLRRVRKTR
jgi:thiol-disulfide isomerase/thioredoxin